jgi:hypothetical protein
LKVTKSGVWLVLTAILLAGMAGCGDDDPVTPEPRFQVALQVTDPGGQPVAGLQLGLAPDGPWYQDGKSLGQVKGQPLFQTTLDYPAPSPFYPFCSVLFQLDQASWVRLDILDIERDEVALLWESALPNGVFNRVWQGLDAAGEPMPPGVYQARLQVSPAAGEPVEFEQTRPMLMAPFLASQVLMGTTDTQGRIVLTDRRLFPYLYDLEPFPSMDEDRNETGLIEFTPAMRFYLTDPATDQTLRFDGDVAGSTTLEFTWNPPAVRQGGAR